MATTLRHIIRVVMEYEQRRGVSFGEQCARELETMIRQAYARERVYIQPADSRQDPERANAIRTAAARLPTGVVSERFGVSRQYVHRIVKK